MDSTASNPESKLYAFEAGRRAIEEHYRRLGIPARVENASFYGMYRTVYEWKEEPLVSIIIPNKDHAEDLKLCLDSIFTKSDYRNFEVVIVENNSTEPETFAYYKELEAGHENVRVVYYEGGFNYSKINNFGAAACRGDYFLLLNNDTEMIDGGCIREMLGYCMREDVGIVGAKLFICGRYDPACRCDFRFWRHGGTCFHWKIQIRYGIFWQNSVRAGLFGGYRGVHDDEA